MIAKEGRVIRLNTAFTATVADLLADDRDNVIQMQGIVTFQPGQSR